MRPIRETIEQNPLSLAIWGLSALALVLAVAVGVALVQTGKTTAKRELASDLAKVETPSEEGTREESPNVEPVEDASESSAPEESVETERIEEEAEPTPPSAPEESAELEPTEEEPTEESPEPSAPSEFEPADPSERIVDDVRYALKEDRAVVIGLASPSSSPSDLILPEEVDGLPVAEIGSGAFKRRTFERIKLPENLRVVGDEALALATLPKFLEIPSGTTDLGRLAFAETKGLEVLRLPKDLTNLAPTAFVGASALRSFEISEKAKAFKVVEGILFDKTLKTIVVYPPAKTDYDYFVPPKSVKTFERFAFSGVASIKTIAVPSSMTEIDFNSLPTSNNFKTLRLPASVSKIDVETESGIPSFKIVLDPKNKRYRSADGALFDKKSRSLLYLPMSDAPTYRVPDGTKEIAIVGRTNLEGVYIPSSVEKIDSFFLTNGYKPATIFGTKGSYAETFAKENSCVFIEMKDPKEFPPEDFEKLDDQPGRFEDKIGKKARVEGLALDGSEFNLRRYRGKWVLIDFWTTWCGFCTREIPFNRAIYEHYAKYGFEIVGVSCDEDLDKLYDFAAKTPVPWTVISTLASKNDKRDFLDIESFYQISAFPTMILVDPDGRIVDANARGERLKELLADAFPDVPIPDVKAP